MSNVYRIISGIGILIAMYLLISQAGNTTKIINTIADNAVNGIQVLQGRSKIIT